jgi:hypothetical protein
MESAGQHQAPGGHYSGRNPIPNIQKFVENLDRDKKRRDKEIEELRKQEGPGGIKPHTESSAKHPARKTVTDPTTGGEVQIEAVDKNFRSAVRNPHVCHTMTEILYND